jgi:hypothetical protein
MLISYYILILIETKVNISYTPRRNRRKYSLGALIFRRVRKIAKSATSFVLSVRPSTQNSASTGRIFIKFDI